MKKRANEEVVEDTVIAAGYRLSVDSWERDRHADRKITVEGLSLEKAKFFVACLKLLERGSPFANLSNPSDSVIQRFKQAYVEILNNFPAIRDEMGETIVQDVLGDEFEFSEIFHDGIDGIVGFAESQNHYSRVVERYVVEYVPTEIRIENVSNLFRDAKGTEEDSYHRSKK